MKSKKSYTIYDLAKELNYSPSTISRALKNHKSISTKTTSRIQEAAQLHGYRPNILAASLRHNQSKTIGILISRINRPFISTLISGIEIAARKEGYNVLISQSNDKYDIEVANSKALFDSRVCGVIASLSMETESTKHFDQFIEQNLPVVFVDRVPENFETHQVIVDNYAAGYKATEHLIKQGCKRIAHFAGSQHLNVYNQRKKGYLDALRDYKVLQDERYIIYMESLSFEEGQYHTEALFNLDIPPDAIFSANDTAGVSAILYLKNKGIKIPEEVAVIGFNDDPISSIVEPALSTISHPALDMGKLSTQIILENQSKNSKNSQFKTSTLATHLIARASSLRK